MIACRTLTDGGQTVTEIAAEIAAFVGAASTSLDLALYDFDLGPEIEQTVAGAIVAATQRGVAVRLAYNVDHPEPDPRPAAAVVRAGGRRGASGADARRSPGSPTSCTTSSRFATGRRCSRARRTGRATRGRGRRTSCSRSSRRALAEAYSIAFEQLWSGRPVMDVGPRRAAARRGRRRSNPAVVLPRVRRCVVAPGGEGDRASPAAGAHLLARDLRWPGARNARRGRERGEGRHRGLRRCDAGEAGALPVGGAEGLAVEDPAARDDLRASALLGEELDAVGARVRSTTSCTRR